MGPALQWYFLLGRAHVPCREAVVVGRRAGGSPPYALHGGARKRGVGDAAPYGWVTSSAVGRADVGIGPYDFYFLARKKAPRRGCLSA